MAASPIAVDSGPTQEKWTPQDSHVTDTPADGNSTDVANGAATHPDDRPNVKPAGEGAGFSRNSSTVPEATSATGEKEDASQRGEKQVKVLVKSPFHASTMTPVFHFVSWRAQCCSICLPICSLFLGRLSFATVATTQYFVAANGRC